MARFLQIGDKVGTLTIVDDAGVHNRNRKWLCECECGRHREVFACNLKRRPDITCGFASCRKLNYKHGDYYTRFHSIWRNLKYRSGLSNGPYKNVELDGWETYEDFKRDMYNEYLDHCRQHGEVNTTIDRKDNRGNYSPANCRWATYSVQNNNRSNSIG